MTNVGTAELILSLFSPVSATANRHLVENSDSENTLDKKYQSFNRDLIIFDPDCISEFETLSYETKLDTVS